MDLSDENIITFVKRLSNRTHGLNFSNNDKTIKYSIHSNECLHGVKPVHHVAFYAECGSDADEFPALMNINGPTHIAPDDETGDHVFDLDIVCVCEEKFNLDRFRKIYNTSKIRKICDCGYYTIDDGEAECEFCMLHASPKQECVICRKNVLKEMFVGMRCCKQEIHHGCLTKNMGVCPFCRTDHKKVTNGLYGLSPRSTLEHSESDASSNTSL